MATPASQVKRSTGKLAAAALRDRDDAIDLKKLLRALQSVRDGDFSVRLPSDKTGLAGKLADAFNDIVAQNQRLANELERAGQNGRQRRPHAASRGDGTARRRVGRNGELGQHADR